ncbi:MAG: hypothetical protein WD876_00570 [Candidatus Pacearchaeota archaeon]
MLKQISQRNKALILLEFTNSLLAHSSAGEVGKLKSILSYEEEYSKNQLVTGELNKEKIKEIVHEKEKNEKGLNNYEPGLKIEKREKDEIIFSKAIGQPLTAPRPIMPIERRRPMVLRIPEPRLPPNLQYLKPTPHQIEIDIGKLNPFIKDPTVRKIDCNGPAEYITVMVPMPMHTNIILSKEEIDEVIREFEKKSKIPATEGIYNVVLGRLMFSAIISEVVGTKFSIKKMPYGFS